MHDNEFFWFHKTLLMGADINCIPCMVSRVHSFADVFGANEKETLFNESRDLQLVVAK